MSHRSRAQSPHGTYSTLLWLSCASFAAARQNVEVALASNVPRDWLVRLSASSGDPCWAIIVLPCVDSHVKNPQVGHVAVLSARTAWV